MWTWHGLKVGSTRAGHGLNSGSMRAQCEIAVGFSWAQHELDSCSTWDWCGLGIGLMRAWHRHDVDLTKDLCVICHKYIYPNADGQQQCIFENLVKTEDNARILVLSGNITHNDTQKFSTRSSLSIPLDAVQAKVRVPPHWFLISIIYL